MTTADERDALLTPDQEAETALAFLDDVLELARRELCLGYRHEADSALKRARRRLDGLAEVAAGWSPGSVSQLTLVRATALALAARIVDDDDRRGNWLFERASALFVEAAEMATPRPDQNNDWAIALAHTGRFEAALERLSIPTADSERGAVAFELGRAYFKYGLVGEARDQMEQAAALAADNPRPHAELARLRLDQGESRDAASSFRAASLAAQRQGRDRDAEALLDRAVAAFPAEPASYLLKAGLLRRRDARAAIFYLDTLPDEVSFDSELQRTRISLLVEVGDLEAAVTLIEAAGDGRAALGYSHALALLGLKRRDEALLVIQQANRLDPANAAGHALEAGILEALDRRHESLACVERSVAIAPYDPATRLLQAQLLRRLGRIDDAVEAARHAVTLAPDHFDMAVELGRCLVLAHGYEEAVRALRMATSHRRDEGIAEALGLLGRAYLRLGRIDEAIRALRRAVKRNRALIDARDDLAYALLEQQRPREARDVLEETLALNDDGGTPADRAYQLVLQGETLRLLGEFSDALTALNEARRLGREDGYTIGTLGQVHIALGERDRGVQDLRSAATLEPATEWIVRALVEALATVSARQALEAAATAEEKGLDREHVVGLLVDVVGGAPDGEAELDRLLTVRPDWATGLVARALSVLPRDEQPDERMSSLALAFVERALRAESGWEVVAGLKQTLLVNLGRTEKARELVDDILDRDPGQEAFLRAKFKLIQDAGDSVETEAFLREVIAMRGASAWAYEELARVLHAGGRSQDALAVLVGALEAGGGETAVQFGLEILEGLGQGERAIGLLRSALEQNPDSANIHGWLAERLWLEDERDAALEHARTSLALDSAPGWIHDIHGWILLDFNCLLEADEAFDRALERDQTSPRALAGKGWCLVQLGQFADAQVALTGALEAPDAQPWVRSLRAWSRQRCGDLNGALEDYAAARDRDFNSFTNRKGVATILSMLPGRYEEAIQALRDIRVELAAAENLDAVDRWSLSGWCAYRMHDWEAAIDDLTKAVAADPLDAGVQFDLALVRLCAGHPRKALGEYRRGLELAHPDEPRSAGLLCIALDDLDRAAEEHPELRHQRECTLVMGELERQLEAARRTVEETRRRLRPVQA